MYKQNKKFNRKKSFEKSQTNSKAEEYNELNEKYNDDHQQQTQSSRKICELKDKSLGTIQGRRKEKRMDRRGIYGTRLKDRWTHYRRPEEQRQNKRQKA